MAASVYHVISTDEESHISIHNWVFRHLCIYKQPTLTKQWKFTIFAQISCSYFRYTGRLFLGCLLFVAHCNTIRASSKTKKERLSYRKKYVEEFEWGISLFWLHALLSISFVAFFVYSLPLPKWSNCRMASIKIYILLWVIFCVMISWVNGRKYENFL